MPTAPVPTSGLTPFLVKTTSKDAQGNVLTATVFAEPGGLTGGYDASGNRLVEYVTRTTPGGSETDATHYQYDDQNRLVQTTLPLNTNGSSDYITQTAYNPVGKADSTADMFGRVTRFFYDARGNLTQTQYPDGSLSRTFYDALGRSFITTDRTNAAPTDPITINGNRTVYDPAGRVVRTERLTGVNLALVSTITSNGTNYDCQLQGADPMVISTSSTEYDAAGRAASTTDERGSTTVYHYDNAGRRITVQDALGNVTTSGYDENGNQTFTTDALGRTTLYVYDDLNRRVEVDYPLVTNETSAVTTTVYDDAGRRTAETDLAGVTNGFQYDGLGRLLAVTNAFNTLDQIVTSYTYDQAGNEVSQTDAAGRVTTFEYDAMGRRTRRTLPGTPPGGQAEETLYEVVYKDGSGSPRVLRKKVTDFNTNVVYYLQDEMDRLATKVYGTNPAAAAAVALAYWPGGQRASMVDASGTNTYAYDEFNRLIKKQTPLGDWAYERDARGNLLSLDFGNDLYYLGYTWDALGRLATIKRNYDNDFYPGAGFAYDAVGNLQGQTNQLGHYTRPLVRTLYHYDARNRLSDAATEAVQDSVTNSLASFNYNPADRPLGPTGVRRAARETIYATTTINRVVNYYYDGLYRLTKEDIVSGAPTGTISYTNSTGYQGYDSVGNRRSRAVSSVALTNAGVTDVAGQVFDDRDRLTSGYTYDGNGNTRTGPVSPPVSGNVACGYDSENRLTWQTNADGKVIHLIYDGDGNRVQKSVVSGAGTATTYYVVDDQNPTGYPQVMAELEPDSNNALHMALAYNYGHNLISESFLDAYGTTTSTFFYGYDGHGNVRYLINTDGGITDTYTYDAFGILIGNTGNTPNNYLYCGEQFDPDLGTYYLRARYYSPKTGRFWTMDTYEGSQEDSLSLHKYLYCQGNPVSNVDPKGHEIESFLLEWSLYSTFAGLNQMVKSGDIWGPWKYVTVDMVDCYNSGVSGELDTFITDANRVWAQAHIKVQKGRTKTLTEGEMKDCVASAPNIEGLGIKGKAKPVVSRDIMNLTRRYNQGTDHITAYFFNDWSSGYEDREGLIAGEACTFEGFQSPPAPAVFLKCATHEIHGFRPFAHEIGHILLDTGYHYWGDESGNLMDTREGVLEANLTPEQVLQARQSRLCRPGP
jgi:RHS repeat-associated protein